jgi:hypothetical protein
VSLSDKTKPLEIFSYLSVDLAELAEHVVHCGSKLAAGNRLVRVQRHQFRALGGASRDHRVLLSEIDFLSFPAEDEEKE